MNIDQYLSAICFSDARLTLATVFLIPNNKQIFPNGEDEIKVHDNVVVVNYGHKIEHIDDILVRR